MDFQRVIDLIIRDNEIKDTFAYIDNVTNCGQTQSEYNMNLSKFMEVSQCFNQDKCIFSQHSINLLGYTISSGTITLDSECLQHLLNLPILTNQFSL